MSSFKTYYKTDNQEYYLRLELSASLQFLDLGPVPLYSGTPGEVIVIMLL